MGSTVIAMALVEWWQQAFDWEPGAMWGGLLVAAACGAVGMHLRWRRLVWTGFAVPQAASVGTAFALGHETLLARLGMPSALPAWFSDADLLVALVTAAVVAWLVPVGRTARRGGERAAAACFLVAATLSVLLVSQSPHGTEEVRALATGKTLLFLLPGDVSLLAWLMPVAALVAAVLARPVAALAFDRDHARAVGHPVVPIELVFALLICGLVVLAAPRAGAPFLFAAFTLPPAAAERIVARPIPLVLGSMLIATAGFLLGAACAVGYDLPFSTAAIGGIIATSTAGLLGAPILRCCWPRH